MNTSRTGSSDAWLDRMQFEADPLADSTISALLDPWHGVHAGASAVDMVEANAAQWQRLGQVSRLFEQWKDNRSVLAWQPPAGTPTEIAAPIAAYLQAAQTLPAWADRAKIARAEAIFGDYGVLSCVLLFCASLPECYVIPDLSQALHVTGQLEQHTEYRIRATAAMIFPVMMQGGLTDPDGGGIAQVLKVRLIHATIRHLILRGSPQHAIDLFGAHRRFDASATVPALPAMQASRNMHQALFAHGWNVGKDGLPCNQEELAYTLLTFHYVFLRGLRTLGIGLARDDEEAYMHAWNVVGHLLGIERELMVETMEQGEALFARIQARGRADPFVPDPRPQLGRALMQTMESVIPLRIAKPFPRLLTRLLCGTHTARDIGIAGRVAAPAYLLFVLLLVIVRAIDGVVRLVVRDFSISRFVTRLVGRQFMMRVLMDESRPLKLPSHVLGRAQAMMQGWQHDPKAPRWMNALESRFMSARR